MAVEEQERGWRKEDGGFTSGPGDGVPSSDGVVGGRMEDGGMKMEDGGGSGRTWPCISRDVRRRRASGDVSTVVRIAVTHAESSQGREAGARSRPGREAVSRKVVLSAPSRSQTADRWRLTTHGPEPMDRIDRPNAEATHSDSRPPSADRQPLTGSSHREPSGQRSPACPTELKLGPSQSSAGTRSRTIATDPDSHRRTRLYLQSSKQRERKSSAELLP